MKERLATEKLYLEDEIRLDQNIGNMVGEGPVFNPSLRAFRPWRRPTQRFSFWAKQAQEKNSLPGPFTT